MKTLQINGFTHVLVPAKDRSNSKLNINRHPEANYRGTGMALCAVLKPGIDVQKWIEKRRLNIAK